MADDEGPSEAAQAFQELRAEVTLMRRAVERLTAERMEVPEPPDYSETLGVIANNITATAQRVDMLVKSPMLAMTPEQLAGRITATQPSTPPLPVPIRTSSGFLVKDLSGKTRIHILPRRFM